ncbi:hypothetical protein GCM10010197_19920 [Nocardioides luteus]|uniref:Uncharacterized protein n=1 Tax=Nocardioides luteus TaxID=1844 RepID=A0ABQ5T266_9ACTN|nr:hypothetical protein GCM10010197_19920 [Nocardioides luteus]GLJ69908.1 hypothetical protein GCM10017579_39440 [Nocardioides luteus]
MESSPRIGRPSEASGALSVADGDCDGGGDSATAGGPEGADGVLLTEGVSAPQPPSASAPRTVTTARDEVIFMAAPRAS